MSGGNTVGELEEGNVALDGAEPVAGSTGGGVSPMLCNSGTAGFGTNIVLRTSRRPRSVLLRLGWAACYDFIRPRFLHNLVLTYRTQGVDHTGHGGVIVFPLLLNRRVSDIEFELRCRITLALTVK